MKKGDLVYNKNWMNKEQSLVLSVTVKGVTLEHFLHHSDYCGCGEGTYTERIETFYDFEKHPLDTWVVNTPFKFFYGDYNSYVDEGVNSNITFVTENTIIEKEKI